MRLIETEIRQLKHKVLDMAELVQLQLARLAEALVDLDAEKAEQIRKREHEIDKYDTKIDKRCARILALYQPVANDLRFVFTTLKLNAMLEQIGDHINSIARKVARIEHPLPPSLLLEVRLADMTARTQELLATALNAFFKQDAALARHVGTLDDAIDEINARAFDVITERIQRTPERAADLLQLLFIIKGMERIADYTEAIADESVYYVEAKVYKHSNKKLAYLENPEASESPTRPESSENEPHTSAEAA